MRICTVGLLAALLFLAVAASAGEDIPRSQFRSFLNGASCEQVINNLSLREGQKDFALMIGSFTTGVNYAKSRDSKIDLKGMMLLAEQFCRQNPKQPAMNALIFLDRAIDNREKLEQAGRKQG